jgi:hypothetical protein
MRTPLLRNKMLDQVVGALSDQTGKPPAPDRSRCGAESHAASRKVDCRRVFAPSPPASTRVAERAPSSSACTPPSSCRRTPKAKIEAGRSRGAALYDRVKESREGIAAEIARERAQPRSAVRRRMDHGRVGIRPAAQDAKAKGVALAA